jgi:hypothetical protein
LTPVSMHIPDRLISLKTTFMKSTIIMTILLVFPFFCFSQYTYKQLHVNFLETEAAAKNYTYENLRLYPVYAKESFTTEFKGVGKYMPLQEALQKGKVKITEKSASGTVNNLSIENLSAETIIVICGDVVKGGKQDRIVQEDIVLIFNDFGTRHSNYLRGQLCNGCGYHRIGKCLT